MIGGISQYADDVRPCGRRGNRACVRCAGRCRVNPHLPRDLRRNRWRGDGYSCGSATISGLGHVARQCVVFDACGINCEQRTIRFDDGSTLVIHESIVNVIAPGNSAGFLEISQTIVGGTGRFLGASGSGTGIVNLDANAVIIASGTITLP